MPYDDAFFELIERWEDLQGEGQAPTADELCCDSPHLLPQVREWIAALKETSWLERSRKDVDESAARESPTVAPRSPAAESVSLKTFVARLVASGLMTADEIRHFQQKFPGDAARDGASLARELIRDNKLTRFQARTLLQGKGSRLLLGDYAILDRIGAGGMGQVFKAQHRSMRRVVALKVLPHAVNRSEAAIKRFQREAHAAARLLHPNIVTAFDAGEAGGLHFLVMEYVEGVDLAAVLQERGPLPVEEAVDYVLQTARGLAYAHAKGIVHRDIKPGNLLLSGEGSVKILDMGLARIEAEALTATNANDGLTQTGQVLGTVDYMAPEQADNIRRADARADLYSLGCTLFRLVTGEPVYGGETVVQRIMAHCERPIPSLTERRPDAPPEIDAIFRRLVAKRPEDRYQRTTELVAELEKWKAERTNAALPPATVAPPPLPPPIPSAGGGTQLRRRLAICAILGLLLIAIAGAWMGYSRGRRGAVKAPLPANAPFDAAQAGTHQEEWASYLKVERVVRTSQGAPMVLIPPGTFIMGATQAEVDAVQQEADLPSIANNAWRQLPQHNVRLSQPFRLGATEVTCAQFRQFVEESHYQTDAERDGVGGATYDSETEHLVYRPDLMWNNPGYPHADDLPVTQVSWNDAAEFCNWLSRKENLPPVYVDEGERNWRLVDGPGYRLPSEAEWECACRAGTVSRFYWGDDPAEYATYEWEETTSGEGPHGVGTNRSNPFGLFDMAGNAREWVADWSDESDYSQAPPVDPRGPETGDRRMQRGGGWLGGPSVAQTPIADPPNPIGDNGF